MRKHFLLLMLMALLPMVGFATVTEPAQGPAKNAKVGASVSGGVVVYQVTGWDGNYKNAAGKEVGAYTVQITGLDYTGLTTKPNELTIETAFKEKYGEVLCNYYVEKIIDTDDSKKQAFYAKTNLTKLTFTITNTEFSADRFNFSIGDYAFFGCTSLAEIKLPSNVSAIGAYAYQNTAVTEVTIPKNCATIKPYAFYNSKSLNTVTVESGNTVLTKLDHHVFANSTVSTLNLSNASALTTIGDATYGSPFLYNLSEVNNQLDKVTLPNSVTTIYNSFAQCTKLSEINNLENTSITAIVDKAFENCSSLPVLNFPKGASGVVLLTGTPFVGCKKLANLTFANGFLGTIGDGSNLYGAADLDVLEKITFNGDMYGVIAANSFVGSIKLGEVEFKGALGKSATINAAFTDVESLTKLTFSGEYSIKTNWNDAATPAVAIADNAFNGTKIAALDFKKIQVEQGSATINAAFASSELATVTFGDIKLGNAQVTTDPKENATVGTLTLKDNAFVSPKLTEAVFGAITADNGASIFTFGDGTDPVFNSLISGSDYALKTVKIAENGTIKGGAAANTIAAYAFKSNSLETVTIGNLAGLDNATYSIGESAFAGAEVNAKTVTIGNISKKTTIEANAFKGTKLTTVRIGNISNVVTIGDNAFFGDELATVEIAKNGSISDNLTIGSTGDASTAPFGGDKAEKSITIGNITSGTTDIKGYAFSGKLLKSVEIGNIGGSVKTAAATVTIGASAFANTTTSTDKATIETEIVKIAAGKDGFVNANSLTINPNAFQAPAKGGEAYNVTIGDLICAPAIEANAFGAATRYGTTTYNLGNVKAAIATTIKSGAFLGSQNNATDQVNTSDVTIKDIDNLFGNQVFKNVNKLTTGKWNIQGQLRSFAGVVEANIGEIPTGKFIAGESEGAKSLTTLNFTGNVADAGAIRKFESEKVRKIAFTAEDPEVAAAAFQAGVFKAAAAAAETANENLVVVYKVKTSEKANQIFDPAAFNDAATSTRNVILYTDEWSKDNVFQHYMDNKGDIYRLSLSASAVVPGAEIAANCITGANAKYAYGRLYIPAGKGMKYYVDAKVEGTTTNVTLYSAHVDGTNIYMKLVDVVEGKYWIDATEIDQVFVVRTTEVGAAAGDAVKVTALPVTDKIVAENGIVAADWFEKALGQKNALKYATTKVKNQELQNNTEFKNYGIYVMANPQTRNLQFALLNQYDTTRDLNKGSLYVLSKKANVYNYAPELNVVWEDEAENDNFTGIDGVETAAENNGAIYNLQGVRVNKAQKGLYIQNGKKYVVK